MKYPIEVVLFQVVLFQVVFFQVVLRQILCLLQMLYLPFYFMFMFMRK